MLAKIAPRFVISRVIQTAYLAQSQMVGLLKLPFGTHVTYFKDTQPQNFYAVQFYGYISTLAKPTSFANKYQEQAYNKACEQLKQFNEVLEIYEKLSDLSEEGFTLYINTQKNNASSNFFSRRFETDQNFENDLLTAIQRFTKVQDSLQAYPEWQEKVKQQIGKWYHLIHNNYGESQTKRKIFNKLHRQEYFI